MPQERRGWLAGDIDGKKAPEAHTVATNLEMPDQPALGPGPQHPAPEPPRELVLRDSAQGAERFCPPASTSSATSQSSAPAPSLQAQKPLQEQGPEEQVPLGASSGGLGPHPPGPATARHGPWHPAKPPRSKATEGPPSAPHTHSLVGGSASSPRSPPVREQDDRAPGSHSERPRPADRKLCPSSVDASLLPERTACPSLQEATRLIQEEFAFDGYLENRLEALIMGTRGTQALETPQDRGGGLSVKGDSGHHKGAPLISAQGASVQSWDPKAHLASAQLPSPPPAPETSLAGLECGNPEKCPHFNFL